MGDESTRRAPSIVRFFFGKHANYVWELRVLFVVCLSAFFLSLAIGFYLGGVLPSDLLEELMGAFPDFGDLSPQMLLIAYFLFIIVNNISKSLIWMILGVAFGIAPVIFAILNGFFVGWVVYSTSLERGMLSPAAALIPHGVVEIPIILLSMAAGLKLGIQLINSLNKRGSLKAELRRALSLFVWRIVPFLFLAAVLEVIVTPLVLFLLGFESI